MLAARLVGDPHPGYDLRISDGEEELHVEVKGSRQEAPAVILTANELLAAAYDPRARLFVASGIRLTPHGGGVMAEGGEPALYRWRNPDILRTILDHYRLSEAHGLVPIDAKWRLGVHNTDLLEAVPLPIR